MKKNIMKNKIIFLGKYSNLGASSRVRIYAYLPYIKKSGFEYISKPLFDNDFIRLTYSNISKLKLLNNIFLSYIRRFFF